MYSNDTASAGIDGQIVMENVGLHQLNGIDALLASLILSNRETRLATGYYWCMITNATTVGLYQNPSTVVHITETCYSRTCDPTEISVPDRGPMEP